MSRDDLESETEYIGILEDIRMGIREATNLVGLANALKLKYSKGEKYAKNIFPGDRGDFSGHCRTSRLATCLRLGSRNRRLGRADVAFRACASGCALFVLPGFPLAHEIALG